MSQRFVGLDFTSLNSFMLFCSPLHVRFNTIKHLFLALFFKKQNFAWERETFKSQCIVVNDLFTDNIFIENENEK